MTTDILAPLATISVPDQASLNSRAESALKMVESMVIDSSETYDLAADELKAIKAKAKSLEDQRTSITGPLNQALKGLNALFKSPAEYLEKAERVIKSKMLAYSEEQERIAAEARRKAEEAARVERERLLKEAAEREAQAKREAQEAIEAGNSDEAARIEADAAIEVASATATAELVTATCLVEPVNVPKAAGISKRSVWKCEVISKADLISFVAKNPQFENLLDVNITAASQLAKAMKQTMAIPGLKAVEEKTLAAGRA